MSRYTWFLLLPALVLVSCVHDSMMYREGQSGASAAFSIPRNNEDLLQDVSRYKTGTPSDAVLALPESRSKAVFSRPGKNLPALVNELTAGEKDDFQKVKNIHDWIALHIQYDGRAYTSGVIPDQSYTSVLKSQKGVCDGYSTLFKTMCDMAGFECMKVYGYSRGYEYATESREVIEDNHAWNAVKIGGAWYLVDVTWDAGSLSSSGLFVPRYDTSYLFIHPRGIIYTHFPSNQAHQFVHPPVSEEEFRDLPYLTGEYYMVFEGPPVGVRKTNSVQSSAVLRFPPYSDEFVVGADLMTQNDRDRLYSGETISSIYAKNVFVERTPEATVVHIHFPEPGKWYVNLYAMKTRARESAQSVDRGDGTYTIEGLGSIQIAEFFYTVAKASDRTFPKLGFRELTDYTLHAPLDNPLRQGQRVRFSFTIPGVKTAFVTADHYDAERNVSRKLLKVKDTSEDGRFEAEMVIPEQANEVDISIHSPGTSPEDGRYRVLVTWDVVE